jgi:hypothetical protein
MMKKAIVGLIVLSLLITLTTTVFAQTGNQILVIPYYQDEITVTTEDELILAAGWAACTPGLVNAWINASYYQWYMDSIPILSADEALDYWGPIEPRGPYPYCLIGTGNIWGSSWRYSIGSLSAGTYVISLTYGANHKIIDGGDYDGDGRLDFFEGQREEAVIVHVVP